MKGGVEDGEVGRRQVEWIINSLNLYQQFDKVLSKQTNQNSDATQAPPSLYADWLEGMD